MDGKTQLNVWNHYTKSIIPTMTLYWLIMIQKMIQSRELEITVKDILKQKSPFYNYNPKNKPIQIFEYTKEETEKNLQTTKSEYLGNTIEQEVNPNKK